jgi:hypothetical protein
VTRAASGCRGMGMPPGLSLLETGSPAGLNRTHCNTYVIAITPLPEAAKVSLLQLQPPARRGTSASFGMQAQSAQILCRRAGDVSGPQDRILRAAGKKRYREDHWTMFVPDLYREGRVIIATALPQLAYHFAGVNKRSVVARQRYGPRRFKRPGSRPNCKKVFGQSMLRARQPQGGCSGSVRQPIDENCQASV